MNETKCIIFNAPPDGGKDYAVETLQKRLGNTVEHREFKQELFRATCKWFGVSMEWFMSLYTRELKEIPVDRLYGYSPRQALIHVSEERYKPRYGKDYFGVKAAEGLIPNKLNAFSDGGFPEEMIPVLNVVGADNFLIVQVYRPGCSYAKDSRMYVGYPMRVYSAASGSALIDDFAHERRANVTQPCMIVGLINDGTKEEYEDNVEMIARRFLEGEI